MSEWFPLLASSVLAVVPVIIWLRIISRQGENKGLYVKTFLIGTLSVVPPFILIFLFDYFPQLNIYSIIENGVAGAAYAALLTNMVVGVIEEIAKNVIVRSIDKRHPEYIQTLGSALRLSICAGLGFSFAENIFYFYNVWTNPLYHYTDLISTFIFRSIITMCGHMVFSGIFGYFFGIGKFASDITEYSRWEGKSLYFARAVSRITGRMTFEVVREMKNLTGLFLAMGIHASFNASLDLGHKLTAVFIVAAAAGYVAYLMGTRSGHLLFSIVKRRASTMAAKDEDVVLELMGMMMKEGKVREVSEICDRLLARDPDNNVVKMFKAQAADNERLRELYAAVKAVFERKKQAGAAAAQEDPLKKLAAGDEKVVLELMQQWYKEGKTKEALEVANRLLARNPNSAGAKLLMDKAIDSQKLQTVADSLARLFL